MTIDFSSVMVDDLDKAISFYIGILGLVKGADIPMEEYRFVTVYSPEKPDGAQLILQPTNFPPSKTYQKALFDAGLPATSLITKDINAEVRSLKSKGVVFRGEPRDAGVILTVVFEDTCGNLVNLVQPKMMPPSGNR